MLKRFPIFTILILFALSSTAQIGWQWGKRGGSGASGSSFSENKVEMVTDKRGNVYVLALISKGASANVDGQVSTNPNNQLSLTKWACDGTHRWTKYFGGDGSISAIASALSIDTLGGLYFTGTMSMAASTPTGNQKVYFDSDVPEFHSAKSWYIVKYDTAGNFQWLRMPQADTVTATATGSSHKSKVLGLDAAPNGDVYVLAHLGPGIFSGTLVSNALNTFRLMRYDKNGNFINAVPVPVTVSVNATFHQADLGNLLGDNAGFARDHNSGNFYITNNYSDYSGSLMFGSTPVTSTGFLTNGAWPMYIAAFDSSGNHLWVEQTDPSKASNPMTSRPRIDEQGNIYICGGTMQGGATFMGHAFQNPASSIAMVAYILSINPEGTLNWGRNAGSEVITDLKGIGYANGIISVSDGWQNTLIWDRDTLTSSGSSRGYNHLAQFNAYTGRLVKKIDTFGVTFAPNFGVYDIASGSKGIFLGGAFPAQVFLPNSTLSSIGGLVDFFVTRYGSSNCNCSLSTPDFSYASSTGSNTVNFTYTGTSGIDSIRWELGDGEMASGLTTSHTYTSAGTYGVSIVVYSSCGIQVFYKDITTGGSTGIGVPELNAKVVVYPNPAHSYITIEEAGTATRVAIYNSIGQQVVAPTIITTDKQNIDVSSLCDGMYIIHFSNEEGKTGSLKFIKE